MGATFIVEDGSIVAGANSYVTVSYADQYFEDYGAPSSWSALSTLQKEGYLRLGTKYIEMTNSLRWKGTKVSSTQPRQWPRNDVYDNDGFLLDYTIIPAVLKEAVCEAALYELTADPLAVLTENGQISSYRVKVGPIEEETEYAVPKSMQVVLPKVDSLLEELTEGRAVSVRRS